MSKLPTTLLAAATLGGSALTTLAGPITAPIEQPRGCDALRGSFGITGGFTSLDGDPVDKGSEDDEFLSALLELRLGYNFAPNWYGQWDAVAEFTDTGDSADDSYHRGWGTAFHVMFVNGSCASLGAFGGWYQVEFDEPATDRANRVVFGLEGLLDYSDINFHWQLGGIAGREDATQDGDLAIRDAYFGRIVANKNLGNGWNIGGEFSAAFGVMDSDGDDLEIYGWGLNVSKQVASNWLLGVVYNGNYYDQDESGGETITEHFVGLNATYTFGPGSDEGCTPLLSMPPILRWMGITSGPLE